MQWQTGGRPPLLDQRQHHESLLNALTDWWDGVGQATSKDAAVYAPKYQVVCKETIQKLLYAWLQRQRALGRHMHAASLSYQEFASKLGEPSIWEKWWTLQILPCTGQEWGPKGQWCRLYRLHNALPPYVRFRSLSADNGFSTAVPNGGDGARKSDEWLRVQTDVLIALESWWDEAGMLVPVDGRGGDLDSSCVGGELDDSSFATTFLDGSIDASIDASINDISLASVDDLDATFCMNGEFKSDQQLNHRDLIHGLYEWLHSDPERERTHAAAAEADKHTFRVHLNHVWQLWWRSRIQPMCGVAWGRCGRFNRRLRLPAYVRLAEKPSDSEQPTEQFTAMAQNQPGTSASQTGPSSEGHRTPVRKAVLEAMKEWWRQAGIVLRPEDITEPMRRELHSDYNVTKHKIQCLLFTWLRSPSAMGAHPVAASVKFRALSSMLGYVWGRWWDSCVAPVVGVRWGGSGHFSNKGVLPFFVRLRTAFRGFDRDSRSGLNDGLSVDRTEFFNDLEDSSFSLLDGSACDLSWTCDAIMPLLFEDGEVVDITFCPSQPPVLDTPAITDSPCGEASCGLDRSPSSVLNGASPAFSPFLQSGLLEALDGVGSLFDDPTEGLDCPTASTPTPTAWAQPTAPPTRMNGGKKSDSAPAESFNIGTASAQLESHGGRGSLWESVDWSTDSAGGRRAHSLFTSDPLHSVPVDGLQVPIKTSRDLPCEPVGRGAQAKAESQMRKVTALPWRAKTSHRDQGSADLTTNMRGLSSIRAPSAGGPPLRGMITRPQMPRSKPVVGSNVAAATQQLHATAMIHHHAKVLTELIAARAALNPDDQEIAQLDLAMQVLQGVQAGSTAGLRKGATQGARRGAPGRTPFEWVEGSLQRSSSLNI